MNPFPERKMRGGRSVSIAIASVVCLTLVLAQSACKDTNGSELGLKVGDSMSAPQARLRVRVETVRRAHLGRSDRVTGTVRAFHRATVTAETQGRVIRRAVESGAPIKAGELIVQLESSRLRLEVRRTQASLRAARTDLAYAKRDYGRAEQLLAQNAMSNRQHDDLLHAADRAADDLALSEVARDTAKRNLADTKIAAPFTGTVDSLMVDVGDFVSLGTPIATLVDLSRVRIFGGVTAREAARLKAGSMAQVTFADLGGRAFEATLQSVGRVAGKGDGTYEIELWMDPGDVELRDGLVAQIDLPDARHEPSLLVHRAAILRRAGHPEVFVVSTTSESSTVRVRPVRTGRSEGEWVEILSGLEEGDLVVWDGNFALEEGSSVVIDGAPAAVANAGSLE